MYLETLVRSNNPKFVELARKWVSRLISPRSKLNLSAEAITLADPFPILRDAVLERAYDVSAHILRDTKRAKSVAVEVAASLEVPYQIVAETIGSSGKPTRKYKVKEPSLLLDQLIYEKTTVQERLQELKHKNGVRQLTEEEMVIRFVKKIVEYAINHNSFYMSAGLHRVLFNYPIHDARKIYQLLVPCPDDRKPSADDFRHHKKRIVDLLEQRFRDFIEVVEYGEQNERRFKKHYDPRRYYLLVEQTLDLLTPSLTDCPLQSNPPDTIDEVRNALYCYASSPQTNNENLTERTRMHMLAHLFCFSHLQALLKIAPAEQVLEVPIFNMNNNGGSSGTLPSDRRTVPKLTAGDKKEMYIELDNRRKRGKKMPVESVEVVIDDIRRGTLSLNESQPVHIELEEGAGIIEFKGSDEEGSLLLGMHSLSWDENVASGEPETYRMTMKGGREVKFAISQTRDTDGTLTGAKVLCSYSHVRQPVTVLSPLSFIHDRLPQLQGLFTLQSPALKLTCAIISIFMTGALLSLLIRPKQNGYGAEKGLTEMIPPILVDSVSTSHPPPIENTEASNQAKGQTAPLPEQASAAGPQVSAMRDRPAIKATVTVRANDELLTTESLPSLPTLTSGIDKSVLGSEPTGVLASGTEVVTLAVTKRAFVKLSNLPRSNNSWNIDSSAFLAAKRIFIKPFPESKLSQDVYSNLIKDLRENRYSISNEVYDAETILEGKVEEKGSSVTLSVLLNNSDGSLVWLKSINSQIKDGEGASVAADLSAKIVKSLSEEREENAYVALDYYLSRADSRSHSQSSITPRIESGGNVLNKELSSETAITSNIQVHSPHSDF